MWAEWSGHRRPLLSDFWNLKAAVTQGQPKTPAEERTDRQVRGRKSHAEINPEMVQISKGLRRRKRGNSLRAIAAELAARGYINTNGKEFSAASVSSMLGA